MSNDDRSAAVFARWAMMQDAAGGGEDQALQMCTHIVDRLNPLVNTSLCHTCLVDRQDPICRHEHTAIYLVNMQQHMPASTATRQAHALLVCRGDLDKVSKAVFLGDARQGPDCTDALWLPHILPGLQRPPAAAWKLLWWMLTASCSFYGHQCVFCEVYQEHNQKMR